MTLLLDHERLEIYPLIRSYNRAIELLLNGSNTVGWSKHIDQLRRAGASIGLNLAEGCGEFAPREKARFYRVARRSATECAACLDYPVDVAVIQDRSTLEAKQLLRRITAMLVRLIVETESGTLPVGAVTQNAPDETPS